MLKLLKDFRLWRWKMGAQRGMEFDKSGHIPICSVLFSGARGHEHAGALVQFQENHNLTRLNRAYNQKKEEGGKGKQKVRAFCYKIPQSFKAGNCGSGDSDHDEITTLVAFQVGISGSGKNIHHVDSFDDPKGYLDEGEAMNSEPNKQKKRNKKRMKSKSRLLRTPSVGKKPKKKLKL
ncbi:hypothetical protein SDJN03_10690, partial [Cucurbita argyrosperma subsp. sororia]